jgi:hypothetical protein
MGMVYSRDGVLELVGKLRHNHHQVKYRYLGN